MSYVRVSRAPLTELEAYKKRMGWTAKWVSSYGSDFNYDYHVSFTKDELATGEVYYNYRMTRDGFDELPGLSVFARDAAGNVFHAYSSYARGKKIRVVSNTEEYQATTAGVEASGALRVAREDGREELLVAGEIFEVK